MADDINTYTFDFVTETAALMALPGAGSVIFVDVRQGSDGKLTQRTIRRPGMGDAVVDIVRAEIVRKYRGGKKRGSFSVSVLLGDGEVMDALIVSDVDPFSNILGTENREIVSLFSLYHEFGHTQIPGPDVDKTHVMSEASADAYAAIRLLQRFGTSVVPFLSMISWVRCYRAIDGSPEHLTSPVLDKIIADAEIQDFSALSAGEAAVRADEYAKAWAPDEKVMERAIPDFQQQSAINMQQLFDTTLMSPDQFSFYVGAKFFQPFLCREGVLMKGKLIQHTERDIRNIARRIERRLQGKGLSWIYNRAAQEQEVPLAEAIKVLQPPGQKGLTVGRAPGPS